MTNAVPRNPAWKSLKPRSSCTVSSTPGRIPRSTQSMNATSARTTSGPRPYFPQSVFVFAGDSVAGVAMAPELTTFPPQPASAGGAIPRLLTPVAWWVGWYGPRMAEAARAVVIGLDAFDTDIALEMVRDGRLPTLASLLDSTAWARTLTPPGMVIGAIWPSISTGCWPSRHGFYCDRQLQSGTYETRQGRPPRHHHASDLGHARFRGEAMPCARRADHCAARDCPAVHSSWSTARTIGSSPCPASPPRSSTKSSSVSATTRSPASATTSPDSKDYSGLRDALLGAGAELKGEVVSSFVEGGGWDFCFAVLGESHCAGHHFWSYHDPSHPAHDPGAREQFGDVLLEVYKPSTPRSARCSRTCPTTRRSWWCSATASVRTTTVSTSSRTILRRLDGGGGGTSRVVEFRERVVRRFGRRGRVRRASPLPVDSGHRVLQGPNNDVYTGIRFNVKGREPRGLASRPGARARRGDREAAAPSCSRSRTRRPGDPLFAEIIRTIDVYDGPLARHAARPARRVEPRRTDPRRPLAAHRHDLGRYAGDPHRRPPPGGLALVRHGDGARAGDRASCPRRSGSSISRRPSPRGSASSSPTSTASPSPSVRATSTQPETAAPPVEHAPSGDGTIQSRRHVPAE